MRILLAMPLAAAAAVTAGCALAAVAHPVAALALGSLIGTPALALAAASGDRPRRILWSAVAIAALAGGLRALAPTPSLPVADEPHVAALRDALAVPLRTLIPEPEGGIVLGIVLGERASIARDLRNAFAVTGTTHLLAISGFNMTLVAAAVSLALRGRARPAIVAVATVLAVASYSILVGPQPSVVRAALMSAIGSLGAVIGRRGVAANALGAAAAVMLVADPRALEDAGFLLSVAATAGLIAWDRSVRSRLTRLPDWLAEGLAATIAASAPTLPVVAAVFGRLSLVSPFVNLAAVPLFAPIMVFGVATAALGALAPGAAWPLAMAAYLSAAALRHAVEIGAAIPFAALEIPPGPLTGVAMSVALILVVVAVTRVTWRPWLPRAHLPALPRPRAPSRRVLMLGAGLVVAVALVAGSAVAAASLAHPAALRLRALDVGQGDAFLLESDGRYALIDGGPDPTLVLRRLGAVLPPWQRRIDLVVLTHEHADHGAGLLGVLDRYEVGLAVEPAGMNDVPLVRFWAEKLARAHVPRRALADGDVIRLGRATLRALAPGRDRKVEVPSLVLHVTAPGSSVLFMGDAIDDAIADVLLDPAALRSRVYVPPHHGAESAHASALVAAVRPEVAVISVGAFNKYGHPAPSTLAALGGVPVYRTDRYGTVDLDLDGHPLAVHTTSSGLPPDRGGPLPSAPAAR